MQGTAKQLAKQFIASLEIVGAQCNLRCSQYESLVRPTQNLLDLSGSLDCLLYFKVRSESPHQWGVTKPRIEELKRARRRWCVVLLCDGPTSGYCLAADDVERYLQEHRWPLAHGKNRNEYKISPGRALEYNRRVESIEHLKGPK